MRNVVCALLLIACSKKSNAPSSGSGSPVEPPKTPVADAASGSATGSAPPSSGPIYGVLFASGTTWSMSGETKTTPPTDMGPPTVEPREDITCTVGDTRAVKDVKLAKVECKQAKAGSTIDDAPTGWYAASPAGLYRFDLTVDNLDAQVGKLEPKHVLIPAVPSARREEIKAGGGDEPEELTLYETKQDGDAWCGHYTMSLGDEGGYSLCFDSKGLVKASSFSAGATITETFYKRK